MSKSKSKSFTLPRLGKGLESLIPKTYVGAGRTVTQLAISSISPNPFQPRTQFDEEAIDQLAHSINENGLAQPILVREVDGVYELIAGERRLRACKKAGLDSIPAIIKNVSDRQSLQLALVENLDRENLNPIEIAKGYQRLINEFQYSHQGLATLFNKSRSSISNTLRLLQLPKSVIEGLGANKLTEGHCRALLALESVEEMECFAQKIIEEKLTVRETEDFVSQERPVSRETSGKRDSSNALLAYKNQLSLMGVKARLTGSEKKGKMILSWADSKEFDALFKRFI